MSGRLGLLPPPTQPGLAPVAHYDAQVGQARLAVGEGRGGGWPSLATLMPYLTTPTPNPSPQGGGARTACAARLCVNTNGTRSSGPYKSPQAELSMDSASTIAIIGAGIGGLAAAL